MSAASGPPPSAASLRQRVANVARKRGTTELRITVAVCNTVIGQMLPPGVVKGGTAMKLRLGEANSRFTPDVDSARRAGMSLDDYIDELEQNLRQGWQGFTGRLVRKQPATPVGVPDDYVMEPFEIKLEYMGKPVKTPGGPGPSHRACPHRHRPTHT